MMYYVYEHSTPDGEIFYVGKGVNGRAYTHSKRSIAWNEKVEEADGICVRIVNRFDNEDEAFAKEQELIDQRIAEGCKLVNQTSGGRGPKDYVQSEATRQLKSRLMKGYKHKTVTCPSCGVSGGETSMKRWHFDKCQGKRPQFKSRITVFGERFYLGKFKTEQEAKEVANEFKEFVLSEADGSTWTVV